MSDIAAHAWTVPRAASGLSAVLACGLGTACAVAAVGLAGARDAPDPKPAPVAAAAPASAPAPPQWLDVIRPVQIFSLEAPQFRQASLTYTARRLMSPDAREDTLAYGTLSGAAPILRLALLRGAIPDAGLAAGLSRLAERQRFAVGLGARRGVLTTRFGRFETASLRISGRAPACDGFHLALSAPALAIDGIACGTARGALACLIDRLDLAAAGEDHALADLFATAELRRNPSCSGMRLGPDVVHAAWLDDKGATRARKVRRSTGF